MSPARRVVTVDGPAGSGKTTMGTRVARQLGYRVVDTGLFYRAVTVAAARAGVPGDDTAGLVRVAQRARIEIDNDPSSGGPAGATIDGVRAGGELYDPAAATLLATVSSIAEVRAALLQLQRDAAGERAVAIGRDCGTVVFPDAQLKVYLDASEAVRERRRAAQLRTEGHDVDASLLRREVALRDRVDSGRAAAPLQRAPDAHVIDTDELGVEDVVMRVLALCYRAGLVPA